MVDRGPLSDGRTGTAIWLDEMSPIKPWCEHGRSSHYRSALNDETAKWVFAVLPRYSATWKGLWRERQGKKARHLDHWAVARSGRFIHGSVDEAEMWQHIATVMIVARLDYCESWWRFRSSIVLMEGELDLLLQSSLLIVPSQRYLINHWYQ